jgi:hypothetical protein
MLPWLGQPGQSVYLEAFDEKLKPEALRAKRHPCCEKAIDRQRAIL